MSDNAAFLAAIRASPDDETPRLVYADWLEERNCPEQAEYLRLVHALTISTDDAPTRATFVERLLEVAPTIDEAWRDAVGRRFDIVMEGWLGGAMFVFMKAVRWLTGAQTLGVMEPNEEQRSVVLRRSLRREDAETYAGEVDPQRFQAERTVKPLYRIVPAAALPALPV